MLVASFIATRGWLWVSSQLVHIIHDDLIIATLTEAEHAGVVRDTIEILSQCGLTLNPKKCVFGKKHIKFWGLVVSSDGVLPDPEKVEALNDLSSPRNKEELVSFLCMMQSNLDFIPDFAKKSSLVRELTKKSARFKWHKEHKSCFQDLVQAFKKDMLLQYFDGKLQTFVFVDAHQTGLSAMLAQGDAIEHARPVAIASRTTSEAEKHYPQLDLEASSTDFGLRCFREYLVGSPSVIKVVTDHKPLVPIFNNRRKGSIHSQRSKLNHQDVPYILEYRKGKLNRVDYTSRHARKLSKLPVEQQKEAQELNSLLYMLHTTPVVDHMSLGTIAKETHTDPVLSKVQDLVRQGKTWVPKRESYGV